MKFGAVGVSNTLLSLLAFELLVGSGLPGTPASAIAFLLGAVNGYCWNRRWTFRADDTPARRLRYLLVQAGGLGMTSALFDLLAAAGLAMTAAYLLTMAAVTGTTFVANRQWTFASRSQRTHSIRKGPAQARSGC